MRRIALIAALLGAAVLAVPAIGQDGGVPGSIEVAAITDSTGGLITGQDVKVAGAVVGSVQEIELTEKRRARIVMDVDGRFAPFRTDARCDVRPAGLIGEKFIQCDPGTPDRPELPERDGLPTVPVEQTSAPIDIDLLLSATRQPVRERFALILQGIGAGVAARGRDLNEVIRRASPALRDASIMLGELNAQRRELGQAIEATDRVLEEVAPRTDRVQGFIRRAREVSERTARRSGPLGEAVQELPALLSEARPTLAELAAVAREARPLATDLRRAARPTRALLDRVQPLADAARPALDDLGRTAVTGRRTLEAVRPVVRALPGATDALRPSVALTAEVMPNLLEKGVPEGLQRFVYFASAALARFDSTSHIFPAHVILSECEQFSQGEPNPDCSARFGEGEGAGEQSSRERSGEHGESPDADREIPGAPPAAPDSGRRPDVPDTGDLRRDLPRVPELRPLVPDPPSPGPERRPQPRDDVLDFLLGD